MRLAMIGLGRMGANMARRLLKGGHELDVFDPDAAPRKALVEGGAKEAESLAMLVAAMPKPRVVWVMVPAGRITEATLAELIGVLEPGDTVVDGGNSNYKETQRRALQFGGKAIAYVDCGTSGGVWGLENGYSLMIGGDEDAVERLRPIFETLAPA
jgi:6-phosphogluconate dehydrogenase